MTPRLNLLLLVLLLLIGVPLYWFQFDSSAPGAKPLPLSLGHLRTLANEIPGPAPLELRQEVIGYRTALYNQIAAGSGLRPVRLPVRAFELTSFDKAPILIDAGTTPRAAKERDLHEFDSAAQRRVDMRARAAALKLLLLDGPLHRGNPALTSPRADPLPDFGNGEPRAVAPGVVAIPLKGLPDRAMMVYARLADGREYLFTGDVAPLDSNWRESRPPARSLATMRGSDERRLVVSWLKTIKALKDAAPAMIVVSGHEPGNIPGAAIGFAKDRSVSAGQAAGHVPIDHVFARSNG